MKNQRDISTIQERPINMSAARGAAMSFFDTLPNRIEGHPNVTPAGWGHPLTKFKNFQRRHPRTAALLFAVVTFVRSF